MSREVLMDLAQQLRELEEQGLENTGEYDELFDEYNALSMNMLPDFNSEGKFLLYVINFDEDEPTFYDSFETYEEAEELGEELVDDGTIEAFKITDWELT